jgi:alcohol dehydrogenase (cytochrome c)
VRPGDNLYTNSVVAFNPEDGALRWHYQWTPHDQWDYDGIGENILFEEDGRKLLAHFTTNGHFFVLDRTDGRLVHVTPYARVSWGEINPTTGQISVERVPTPDGTHICPGPAGAKEWTHASYSRRTKLLYVPVIEACGTFKLIPSKFAESMPYWGGEVGLDKEQLGNVKAIDPMTGREVWRWDSKYPIVASLLTTAGDLAFVGDPSGIFHAFDARSGTVLWTFNTGSGIHSSPISYSVNGKQYIAVPTGWGGWLSGFAPEMWGAPRGTALMVFALP